LFYDLLWHSVFLLDQRQIPYKVTGVYAIKMRPG
jgi:hypothetical protein